MAALTRSLRKGPGATLVTLVGILDAQLAETGFIEGLSGDIVIDLSGVPRVTSFGISEWVRGLARAGRVRIFLVGCQPSVVSQLNTVAGFAGNATIVSLFGPFACAACGAESTQLFDLRVQHDLGADDPTPIPCPNCGERAEFDDDPASYFSCVAGRPAPELPGAVVALLTGNSAAPESAEVRKDVEGDVTAIWLRGMVTQKTRLKRVVEGVEGDLVVLCAGITGIDAAGADRLLELVAAAPDARFARVRPEVLEAISDGRRGLAGHTISIVLPATCAQCGGTEASVSAADLRAGSGRGSCLSCSAPVSLTGDASAWRSTAALMPPASVRMAAYMDAHPGDMIASTERTTAGVTPMPTPTLSRYKLVRKLGRGGMAEVYLAEQTGPGAFSKRMVVKCILPELATRPDFVRMFMNEARVAALVTHTNVVQIFDLGEENGRLFIAMEYVDGSDLSQLIQLSRRAKAPVPVGVACRIAADMCAGLHAAHSATDPAGKPLHLVHRDISPHNVLLTSHGVSKVSDFGISKTASAESLTEPGQFRGKLAYMAPEQLGDEKIDARADVFAAALVAYQLLTGVLPFRRSSPQEVIVAVLRAPIRPLRELRPDASAHLEQVLMAALERDRSKRTQTAEVLAHGFEQELRMQANPTLHTDVARWLTKVTAMAEEAAKNEAPLDVLDLDVEIGTVSTKIETPNGGGG